MNAILGGSKLKSFYLKGLYKDKNKVRSSASPRTTATGKFPIFYNQTRLYVQAIDWLCRTPILIGASDHAGISCSE